MKRNTAPMAGHVSAFVYNSPWNKIALDAKAEANRLGGASPPSPNQRDRKRTKIWKNKRLNK
jgi:hypothetical protein